MHASWAEIGSMHAGARGAFVKHHQLLTFLEAPQRRCKRADIKSLGGDVEKMGEQPTDLGIKHTDELAAFRHGEANKPFHRKGVSVLLIHRSDVVEPVEIG